MALVVKTSPASAGDVRDMGSVPGLGRCPGGGHGNHSSILAWRIPWTQEPSGLQSIGSQRAGHDWSDLACMYTGTRTHTGMLMQVADQREKWVKNNEQTLREMRGTIKCSNICIMGVPKEERKEQKKYARK